MVDGIRIVKVYPHYEQMVVVLDDDTRFFISYEDLIPVLSEFIFEKEKKRTRTWIHPVTPDVNLLYHQEKYPEMQKDDS